jgi:hypothetical protein
VTKPPEHFSTAAVVSVYHYRLACDFDEMRECLDYIVGKHVLLPDIPRYRQVARATIKRQHPRIEQAGPPSEHRGDSPSVNKWAKLAVKKLGAETLPLRRASQKDWSVLAAGGRA